MKNLNIHIVGLGNLGSAFLNGLIKSNLFDRDSIKCYETNVELSKEIENSFNLKVSNEIPLIDTGILVMCIKPQFVNQFLQINSSKIGKSVLICSPIAGLRIDHIEKQFSNKIIRIMPNLLISSNRGFIPFSKNYEGDYLNFISETLSALGIVKEFDENLFPLITALSGSGPAWYYQLSSHLVKAGSELGLSLNDSEIIIKQLIKSMPDLVNDDDSFSNLVEKVKSPKGTTEAGLNSLENDSFDNIVHNAIKKATNRSIEISKELESE